MQELYLSADDRSELGILGVEVCIWEKQCVFVCPFIHKTVIVQQP